MQQNNLPDNKNKSSNATNNTSETSTAPKKLNPSHIAKSKLLRQKLREKKNKLEAEKNQNLNDKEECSNTIIPNDATTSSSNNLLGILEEKEKEKEKEKIDPLKFIFSTQSENRNVDDNDPLSYLNLEIKEEKQEENVNKDFDNIIVQNGKDEPGNVVSENNIVKNEIQEENSSENNIILQVQIQSKNSSSIVQNEIIENDINVKDKLGAGSVKLESNNNNNQEIKVEKEAMNMNQELNEESDEIPKIIILEASNRNNEFPRTNIFETPDQKNDKISPQKQIQKKTPTKQFQFSKFKKQSDSDSSSSSDESFENNERQRLINIKNAQQNLFRKNRTMPKETDSQSNKKQNELTKEDILQKLCLDFNETSELLELNEKKKQIMLKKMRRTLRRLSNLRLRNMNQEEETKRNLINRKLEELKKFTGDNYNKIKENVDEIFLNLKMPDYYFADDEDVEIIYEKELNNKCDIKPILDIDFTSFMRQ